MIDRRAFVKVSAGAVAVAALDGCRRDRPAWEPGAERKTAESRVAILAAGGYDRPLEATIRTGIELFGLEVRGRRVVLKPNLVEFDPRGVINTNPAVIGATVATFHGLGAREVIVAEGPGHRRDNEYLLTTSGLHDVLRDTGAPYVDLNQDAAKATRLVSRYTEFGELFLPETVLGADLIVSMPKLKTHHWAGITLSLKNMFGIVPGSVYGWPKNPLHWAGIQNSILDINAAISIPRFNIVDGIVGMEGNGPIQGEPRASGVLVFGPDPVAVDATCARLMSIDPWRIWYLEEAARFLGNAGTDEIRLIGESLEPYQQDYSVLESFQHTKVLPAGAQG
jgi:uncharacterized protein (DUF362 family)